MDKKKLWITEDRASDGTAFIAEDIEISENSSTYVRLDEKYPNNLGKICDLCGQEITKGWFSFDDYKSYCDDHVEIMN